MLQQDGQGGHRIDPDAVHDGSFGGVFGRDEGAFQPMIPGGDDHGEHTGDAADVPGQGQFPDESAVVHLRIQLAAGPEQGEQEREVVHRPLLADIRRCQIDRDAADRIGEAAVFHGGADPVPGFLDCGAGQSYHVEARQSLGKIGLHIHHEAVHAEQTHAVDPGEHLRHLLCLKK